MRLNIRQLIVHIYYSACHSEEHSKWGSAIVTVISVLGHSFPFLCHVSASAFPPDINTTGTTSTVLGQAPGLWDLKATATTYMAIGPRLTQAALASGFPSITTEASGSESIAEQTPKVCS